MPCTQSSRTFVNFRSNRVQKITSSRSWRLSGRTHRGLLETGRLEKRVMKLLPTVAHSFCWLKASLKILSVLFFLLQEEAMQRLAGPSEEVPELPWPPEYHHAESRADHQ